MRKLLFFLLCLMCLGQSALAQPATFGVPISIGRNNCAGSGGTDSMYFFNYANANLTRAYYPNAYRPRLKIGPTATADKWTISAATISFNPKDQKLYYLWTNYSSLPYRTYIWRWRPDTTFSTVASPGTANFLDTLRSFPYDIGGVAFDNNGIGWTLEFPATVPTKKAFLRPIDFAGNIYNAADTLDFTWDINGVGDTLYNVGSGDITMMPNGQIYYNFDNKLYTPDYGSYGGPTRHIKSTFIDSTKKPTAGSSLIGLAYADGTLLSSYSSGCVYRRLDPVYGDTLNLTYTYAAGKGVYSADMTQLSTGVGSAKKLVSLTPTGTPGQYDVVYDVYVKNYGTMPLTNLQLQDNLANINGAANLSNVTYAFTNNPAGLLLNPLYNGNSNINLLVAGQSLANYPTSLNNFTIRVSCRLSNILSGIVYNNSASVTGNGFNLIALRDSSTNGNTPDLNQNDKPDDVGENQPTPFVIAIDPTPYPCTPFNITTYNQDFGNGAGLFSTIPPSVPVPSASSTYIGSTVAPLGINRFTLTNNANLADPTSFISLSDHTGVGANPRMLVVNADAAARYFYVDTLPTSCPGQQYSLSFWGAFIGNAAYKTVCDGLGGFRYPKIKMELVDITTGLTVVTLTSADITATTWQELGMTFVMPPGYFNLILRLSNAGAGGCGNDVALDDIKFGSCSALPIANASGSAISCLGLPTTFTSSLANPATLPGAKEYKWQVAPTATGPWADISGATSSTYTIPAVAGADTGKYYRVIIAALGNMSVTSCQFISPAVYLSGLAPSVAPTSVSITAATICVSGSTTLTAVGGTLGTGANYQWGTGSVVGTSPIAGATGSTLTVSPGSTTTYWVQIQNTASPCTATTGGVTQVVTVNQPSTAPTSITGADFCNPGSTTLTAVGGILAIGANYQWGTGAVVGTSPIAGATSSTLTVSPGSTTTFWVRIENNPAPCTASTAGITKVVIVMQSSVAAGAAVKNKNNICPGIPITLSQLGGTLGTGASWKWYTGSCATTLVGTGANLIVAPAVTTTYYVRAEGLCNTTTCVAVTVNVSCDIDKDKDGIPDFVESNMSAAFLDVPANGIINAYDPLTAGFIDNNGDYVNDNYQADGDSDNDGIPNYLDTDFSGRVDTNADGVDDRFDTDLDGKINMLDLDSDNDGIPDVVEAYGVDTNGDGKIDNFTDTDGDGLSDNVDTRVVAADGAYNTGIGLGIPNLDGDIVPNFLDLDSDNDGIPDLVESGGADVNNNGRVDVFTDLNNDGFADNYTGVATGLILTGADVNGDGKTDSYPNKNLDRDFRPNAYDMDADGDGIVDVIEAGLPDVNLNGIVDGVIGSNGWSTTVSTMPALNLRNTDASGNPDYLDIDADNDGIPDNIEGMSTVGYLLPTTLDTDGDGLMAPYDNVVGFGGSGIFVYDHDSDGTPDYRDLDTDGDGSSDICEGNDWNLNGFCDELLTLTGLDTDGDGLDNRFDSLNSVTNIKGTSYMMGNGGILTGDAAPGTKATVQKKIPSQLDRDWRSVGSVLPVQFLNFSGFLENTQVPLNWTVITTKYIDHFEIERSTDNNSYLKVGVINDAVLLNTPQSFGFTDNVAVVNSDIIYYRLKAIGKSGEIKYSNILVVRRSSSKTPVTIMPNPAKDFVVVKFFVEKESEVIIRLLDNTGKNVLVQKQKVNKGNNAVQLTSLSKLSNGMYTLQLLVNDEIINQKLILSK